MTTGVLVEFMERPTFEIDDESSFDPYSISRTKPRKRAGQAEEASLDGIRAQSVQVLRPQGWPREETCR